nr:preprotein translocase subunit SecA [Acinetobacter sp. MB5]
MQKTKQVPNFQAINHNSLQWKIYLGYDIFMMFIIVFNLFCISANAILMSHFAIWLSEHLHAIHLLNFYKTELNPWVNKTEGWFICFLIVELLLRWLLAITQRHHQRWFFFPFIHWYEILAIIPQLRFLRLFRAGIIAYRLHELGYEIIPETWQKAAKFYYQVLMEELSDRVVITVIDGIRYELDTSSTHKKMIHDLVDHHREIFAKTLAELLQENLANELKRQQQHLAQHVGLVVEKAIIETPELHQLLRLFPIIGSRLEEQIQSIGKRLGENITQGLLEPWAEPQGTDPNKTYQHIANKISQIDINNADLEKLIESVFYESLAAIRKQVKIKQWQNILIAADQNKTTDQAT